MRGEILYLALVWGRGEGERGGRVNSGGKVEEGERGNRIFTKRIYTFNLIPQSR